MESESSRTRLWLQQRILQAAVKLSQLELGPGWAFQQDNDPKQFESRRMKVVKWHQIWNHSSNSHFKLLLSKLICLWNHLHTWTFDLNIWVWHCPFTQVTKKKWPCSTIVRKSLFLYGASLTQKVQTPCPERFLKCNMKLKSSRKLHVTKVSKVKDQISVTGFIIITTSTVIW